MTTRTTTGRGWAYASALLGGAVSMAANVAHSYVPPTDTIGTWSPPPGAVVGAVFWPIALFAAVEVFARIQWPHGRRWTALRFGGLLPVALVAAIVSYRHLSGLLAFYREDALTAAIGPLAVDGLMVMATGALIATGTRRTGVTIEATQPAAPQPPVVDSTAPPVTTTPTGVDDSTPPAVSPEPATDRTHETAAANRPTSATRAPKRRASTAERVARAAAKTPDASPAQIAARLKLSERTVQRHMSRSAVDTTSDAVSTPSVPTAVPVAA